MARFRCRACGQEGTFEYEGRHACPRCGSPNVQFAMVIEEMPDELIDRIVKALSEAAKLDDHPDDKDC